MTNTKTHTTITSRQTGMRKIQGTDHPVVTLVERVQLPHDWRAHWLLVHGLCDGTPLGSTRFATRRAALAAFTSDWIADAARAAAETYRDDCPGEPYDDAWATAAYEIDSARAEWPDGSYDLYSLTLRAALDY